MSIHEFALYETRPVHQIMIQKQAEVPFELPLLAEVVDSRFIGIAPVLKQIQSLTFHPRRAIPVPLYVIFKKPFLILHLVYLLRHSHPGHGLLHMWGRSIS